jgi:hypothetical protein
MKKQRRKNYRKKQRVEGTDIKLEETQKKRNN